MERGSDKHARRLDEALKGETAGLVSSGHDTHAEEWKSSEPSGEDQPAVSRSPNAVLTGGTPEGMTEADVQAQRAGPVARPGRLPGPRPTAARARSGLRRPRRHHRQAARAAGRARVRERWRGLARHLRRPRGVAALLTGAVGRARVGSARL